MADNKTLSVFQKEWEVILHKGFDDFNSLNPDERIWFNIQCLIGDVDNGGLISHYYNSGADHNKETIEDLIKLGCKEIAELIIKINTLFPNNQPSNDFDERNEVISNWDESLTDKLLNQLDLEFYDKELELEEKLIKHIEAKLKGEHN